MTKTREYVRPLMRPEWRAWRDIVASETVREGFGAKSATLYTWSWREDYWTKTNKKRTRKADMTLSSYCDVSSAGARLSLDVTLTEQALEAIKARALTVSWDTINLSVNIWPDGETLVTYHHSRIIGGSWIAVVDSSSLPPALCVGLSNLPLDL